MTPEPECSQPDSQKLPDTCPISQTDLSQPLFWPSQNTIEPWGRLYPTKRDIQPLDLIKDEYTVGRGSGCDLLIGQEAGQMVHGAISKVHFKIKRTSISKTNHDDYIVHLEDLSFNGTFVNGRKVGRGKSVILENHNEISVCFAHYKAFIYISSNLDYEVKAYPEEVKMNYAISRTLGSGSFGQVKLVFDKSTGKALAMKIIQKKRFCDDENHKLYDPVRTKREVDVLKALSNVFIIKFVNVIDSKSYMFILTEYMEGGELFDRVKGGPLIECDAKLYFFQLAMAVQYLHDNGIIHRDIKLENILLSSKLPNSLIKLCDFGFSKFLDSESVMMTFCGTPQYIAPEILKSTGKNGSYDEKVDIWSMGVVLYTCLSGVTPFASEDKHHLTEQILKGKYTFPSRQWAKVSRRAINLVRRMLIVNPKVRISTDEILRHDWLKDRTVSMRVNRLLKKMSETTAAELTSRLDDDSDTENTRRVKRARVDN